ncbi:oxygenase MpaB family protein [Hymenobacter psoromatis]|uniref:oxygenase MpaB family protein n=1 Tax=Hymenobacter psoromatis TaxID=1484116 RepID=UPI001CBAEB02|nr:oxygenase MpaB family protein [Hymenobacter psoromatis]
MEPFVAQNSVVRRIWGTSDIVLFIFAGAAAEFALNKAVDWLYFTGRLPADPLGRLFSTVDYSRRILFSDQAGAGRAIASIAAIHGAVEASRGQRIPAWAYRDVLYLLIAYSIGAFELLERPLTPAECEEIVAVFGRVGRGLGIPDLPTTYPAWQADRARHLAADLAVSPCTIDLYRQYKKHLGGVRYGLLRGVQGLVVPPTVRRQLGLGQGAWLRPALAFYRATKQLAVSQWLKNLMLPAEYAARIRALDEVPAEYARPAPAPVAEVSVAYPPSRA